MFWILFACTTALAALATGGLAVWLDLRAMDEVIARMERENAEIREEIAR